MTPLVAGAHMTKSKMGNRMQQRGLEDIGCKEVKVDRYNDCGLRRNESQQEPVFNGCHVLRLGRRGEASETPWKVSRSQRPQVGFELRASGGRGSEQIVKARPPILRKRFVLRRRGLRKMPSCWNRRGLDA